MRKSRWLLRAAALIALILPAALMLGPSASDASAIPSSLFATQAKAAHLTVSQQATLQSRVNKIIARYGGHQIGLNEVALPHGASVLFPLPGQRVPRVLPGTPPLPVNQAMVARATRTAGGADDWSTGETWYSFNGASCPFYYFCAWQDLGFSGVQFNVSWCNVQQELPGSGWDNNGDDVNNQSFGTHAYLLNQGQELVNVPGSEPDTGPPSADIDWLPIWYIEACAN